jgi:hypothetical protein
MTVGCGNKVGISPLMTRASLVRERKRRQFGEWLNVKLPPINVGWPSGLVVD